MGFLNGFAKLGILKPLGDTGLSIDGSLSVQGFAQNLGELGSQGSFTLGDIEGGYGHAAQVSGYQDGSQIGEYAYVAVGFHLALR